MALNVNAKAGDESRRNGDYLSFPTQETDNKRLSQVSVPKGVPATLNTNGKLAEATLGTEDATTEDPVVGIVYEYDVYGGNQGSGNEELVDADAEATVKTRGAVYADLSGVDTDGNTGDDPTPIEAGQTLGAGDNILVVEETQTSGVWEVLVR